MEIVGQRTYVQWTMYILVIDDSDGPLPAEIGSALVTEGHRIGAARGADDVRSILAGKDPDVIVACVRRVDTVGFPLLQLVRSEPRLRRLPVIVLTEDGERVEPRARSLGVEWCLALPVDGGTVRAAVRAAVDAREAEQKTRPPGRLDASSSGVPPLDAAVGGLPSGRAYYLTGEVGTGKGVFAVQFLHHVLAGGGGAVLVTTERPRLTLDLASDVGLDLAPFLRAGRLALFELAPNADRLMETTDDYRCSRWSSAAMPARCKRPASRSRRCSTSSVRMGDC